MKSRFVVAKWTKHGQTPLYVPGDDPLLDLTVFMYVLLNPGHHSEHHVFRN